MITLTTPAAINSVLGGNVPISYDKMVISPFQFFPINRTVQAQVQLSATASPDMPLISGTLTINLATGSLDFQVPQLDFYRSIVLTAGQVTALQTIIDDAQNALEAGLISLVLVDGVQSTGV